MKLRMKLRTIIAALTLMSWLAQNALVALLMAIWTGRFIMRLCCYRGAGLFGHHSEQFIVRTLEVLLCPLRQLLSPDWFGNDSLEVCVLLTANSLVWGVGLGIAIYSLQWTAERMSGGRQPPRRTGGEHCPVELRQSEVVILP